MERFDPPEAAVLCEIAPRKSGPPGQFFPDTAFLRGLPDNVRAHLHQRPVALLAQLQLVLRLFLPDPQRHTVRHRFENVQRLLVKLATGKERHYPHQFPVRDQRITGESDHAPAASPIQDR